MDKLAKVFEFYEKCREEQDIQFYGMATWLCFRAKPDEENIYLNFQKVVELAETVGGPSHGFRFAQVPMSVMMPEAFVEPWQEFNDPNALASPMPVVAADSTANCKILVVIANLLKMNLIASKPLLEGRVKDIDIPTIKNISDPVAKHL